MTGRFRFGKISIGMRNLVSARPSTVLGSTLAKMTAVLARATATTATMTVYGLRKAKTIGFIEPDDSDETAGKRLRARSQHAQASDYAGPRSLRLIIDLTGSFRNLREASLYINLCIFHARGS